MYGAVVYSPVYARAICRAKRRSRLRAAGAGSAGVLRSVGRSLFDGRLLESSTAG